MHDVFDYIVLAFIPLMAIVVTALLFVLDGYRKWRNSIDTRLRAIEIRLAAYTGQE